MWLSTWGGLVTIDMFLGGMGAGVFAIAFVLILIGGMQEMTLMGALLGPVLVIVGLIFLFLELRSPRNMYRVLTGFSTSWMSRGALLQTLFILFGLIYAVPAFFMPDWFLNTGGTIVGIIAFVLALLTAAYHGVFLSEARGVPVWSSPVLPVASFFTALCSGLGLMLLLFLAFVGSYPDDEVAAISGLMALAGIVFIIAELIILWSLLSSRYSVTFTESIKTVNGPVLSTIVCLVVSLVILFAGLWVRGAVYMVWTSAVSGLLLLASSYIIRSAIIKAGHYYPLQVPMS